MCKECNEKKKRDNVRYDEACIEIVRCAVILGVEERVTTCYKVKGLNQECSDYQIIVKNI